MIQLSIEQIYGASPVLRGAGRAAYWRCFRMNEPEAIKVLIVNEDGQYLAGTATEWEFTEERTRARVFDYADDHVASILKLVKNIYGTVWIAVKLDPSEAYEFCDRCGSRMSSLRAFFDGERFICPECRKSYSG